MINTSLFKLISAALRRTEAAENPGTCVSISDLRHDLLNTLRTQSESENPRICVFSGRWDGPLWSELKPIFSHNEEQQNFISHVLGTEPKDPDLFCQLISQMDTATLESLIMISSLPVLELGQVLNVLNFIVYASVFTNSDNLSVNFDFLKCAAADALALSHKKTIETAINNIIKNSPDILSESNLLPINQTNTITPASFLNKINPLNKLFFSTLIHVGVIVGTSFGLSHLFTTGNTSVIIPVKPWLFENLESFNSFKRFLDSFKGIFW